jgi:hypothetical protein
MQPAALSCDTGCRSLFSKAFELSSVPLHRSAVFFHSAQKHYVRERVIGRTKLDENTQIKAREKTKNKFRCWYLHSKER